MTRIEGLITTDELDPGAWAAQVSADGAGAIVSFSGLVRDHDQARAVVAIDYEGHPGAAGVLAQLLEQWAANHPAVVAVGVAHRLGHLRVGEVAFCAAVSAAHRQAAFLACAELVDEVKANIPIWKRQWFADGTSGWVGAP